MRTTFYRSELEYHRAFSKSPQRETEESKVVVQPLYSRFLFQLRGKMINLLLQFQPKHSKHMTATDVSSLEKRAQ
jgi:hypothetical protein